ncbi:hypothetical protein MC885_016286 [Smutsia gigantea]|nr:hypothetical protein MC885_016286 [Smutsia gigantea]
MCIFLVPPESTEQLCRLLTAQPQGCHSPTLHISSRVVKHDSSEVPQVRSQVRGPTGRAKVGGERGRCLVPRDSSAQGTDLTVQQNSAGFFRSHCQVL